MFEPGSLRERISSQTAHALRTGTLQPIATTAEYLRDGEVEFVIRVVSSLARKPRAARRARARDPYLPYDDDLFVTDVSASHVCLLNKFPVMAQHVLIVTREFEEQESLLDEGDIDALRRCMEEFDSLGFYNSGEVAGASQRHKHLQLLPLPLSERGSPIPTQPLIDAEALPFAHAFSRIGNQDLHTLYAKLLERASLDASTPYNLLMTQDWMLIVPRGQEHVAGVSINALGFAGSLFVESTEELERLRDIGPMQVLITAASV
jgi:ATP adenylyltransferase